MVIPEYHPALSAPLGDLIGVAFRGLKLAFRGLKLAFSGQKTKG
jgi:hypothetical protein